jgi:2-dehydropantoate 2-reductase
VEYRVAVASDLKVGVMGAGSVGCWIGGRLAARGVDVVFVGRARQKAEIDAAGLSLTDLGGEVLRVEKVAFATEIAALGDRDVVLCCVKSAQTAEAAAELAKVLSRGAIVVSMQNGMRNPDVLRAGLGEQTVLGGIVGFNVLSRGGGAFRRATSGPLVIEASADPRAARLVESLASAGLEIGVSRRIRLLQWSKLVMNLNNAVSALSGAPTRDLLDTAGYRRILAGIIAESLAVLKKAGIRPARFGVIPVQAFPFLLGLPTRLIRVVARAQLDIDPEARSSMWEDLSRGRTTEIEELNGEIVRLAESCGADATLNRRVVALVHEVEARGAGSPRLTPDELARALGMATR